MHFGVVPAFRMGQQSEVAYQLLSARVHGRSGIWKLESGNENLQILDYRFQIIDFRFQVSGHGITTMGARQKVAFATVGSSTETWQS